MYEQFITASLTDFAISTFSALHTYALVATGIFIAKFAAEN